MKASASVYPLPRATNQQHIPEFVCAGFLVRPSRSCSFSVDSSRAAKANVLYISCPPSRRF